MSLRIRRGTDAQRSGIVFDQGEIIWTTDFEQLWVGDGVTAGGKNIAAQLAGTGLHWNTTSKTLELSTTTFNTNQITEGNNNLYFTTERAENAVWSALNAGNSYNTGITFSYDDVNHRISGTVTIPTETVQDTIASLFTTSSHYGMTFIYNDELNSLGCVLSNEVVQDVAANLFIFGIHTGITYSYDDTNNIIDSSVSPEFVQDQAANLFTAAAHNGISYSYDDLNNQITSEVSAEYVQDKSAEMFTGGTHTGIELFYNDLENTMNLSVQREYIQDEIAFLFTSGVHSGIQFVYNDLLNTLDANVTYTLVSENSPQLGGSLDLGSHSISGIGDIDITGYISNSSISINENVISSLFNVIFESSVEINKGTPDPAILIKNTSSPSFGTLSKLVFESYGSSVATPSNSALGDYCGSLVAGVYNVANDGILPSVAVNFQIDPAGVINDDVANGKFEIATIGGTSVPSFNYLTFDSKGQLAVNQQTAQATVDINGTMRLAPLNAAPSSPVNGMLAIANGSGWNPTSTGKQTLVAYLGGSWIQVAVAP